MFAPCAKGSGFGGRYGAAMLSGLVGTRRLGRCGCGYRLGHRVGRRRDADAEGLGAFDGVLDVLVAVASAPERGKSARHGPHWRWRLRSECKEGVEAGRTHRSDRIGHCRGCQGRRRTRRAGGARSQMRERWGAAGIHAFGERERECGRHTFRRRRSTVTMRMNQCWECLDM